MVIEEQDMRIAHDHSDHPTWHHNHHDDDGQWAPAAAAAINADVTYDASGDGRWRAADVDGTSANWPGTGSKPVEMSWRRRRHDINRAKSVIGRAVLTAQSDSGGRGIDAGLRESSTPSELRGVYTH